MKNRPKEDIDYEIAFLEGVVEKSQDFLQALSALGDLYTRKGLHEKGLEIDKRLSQLRYDDPIVFYNLACSYSLVNKVDRAFEAMKLAIENGYDDFVYLEKDRDLINLLNDNRFKKHLSRIKEKQAAPAKKNSV